MGHNNLSSFLLLLLLLLLLSVCTSPKDQSREIVVATPCQETRFSPPYPGPIRVLDTADGDRTVRDLSLGMNLETNESISKMYQLFSCG